MEMVEHTLVFNVTRKTTGTVIQIVECYTLPRFGSSDETAEWWMERIAVIQSQFPAPMFTVTSYPE